MWFLDPEDREKILVSSAILLCRVVSSAVGSDSDVAMLLLWMSFIFVVVPSFHG